MIRPLAGSVPPALPIYAIAVVSLFGVVVRPWRTPEVAWAVAGAVALVLLGLLPLRAAFGAIGEGTDVHLFLLGLMLLSALADAKASSTGSPASARRAHAARRLTSSC